MKNTGTEILMMVGERPLLLAFRRGLAQILPLIIAGAAALLLLNLPLPALQSALDAVFGPGWRHLCQLIQQGSFGIASLAVLISISYSYSQQKTLPAAGRRVNPIVTTAICLSCYFVVALPLEGDIVRGFFSLSGGFPIALCVAATSTPIFLFITEHSPFNRFLFAVSSDPEINDALAAIPTGAATIFVFGLVRMLMEQAGLGDLHHQAQALFGAPFQGTESGLGVGIGYVALSQFLWFFGVHGPNLLITVENNVLAAAAQANVEAVALGLKPAFILTKPFLDAFVHIGGSGSTLSLIVAIFLRSKEKNTRRLALAALLPALFNVNEPLLFGLPLVLNPIYAIPFLLAPVVQTAAAYAATALGLVPAAVGGMHWTSPILLGGYAATGSYAGSVLQIFCLIIGTLIYLPFVRLANSVYGLRFRRAMDTLAVVAEGTATGPTGKKCIDQPNQTGQFAKVLAADLSLALDRDDQIFLVYQPLVDVDQVRVVGAEVLLRWQHPVHGLIPPHVTVALAEDTDLISKLGLRVLADACMQQVVLLGRGRGDPILSFNVSALQFEDEHLADKIADILKETGLDPGLVKVEVTESIALTPEAKPIKTLRRLREMGMRVAIDDFGMGHTSLRYLKEFPVDTIKIDRSLTQESADGVNEHIITSIVSLCEALDVQIIVEGVETVEQLRRFRDHRCSLFQGYLFSKPLSGEAYVEFFCETGEADIRAKLEELEGRPRLAVVS